MWFRNLKIYRLKKWDITPTSLEEKLSTNLLTNLSASQIESKGWIPPKVSNSALVHTAGKHLLIALGYEKKLLPAAVVNQYTKTRIEEFEKRHGYAPGRKQAREIKEMVTIELIPRAFTLRSKTLAWIDPVGGWFAVDAISTTKTDELVQLLHKSLDEFQLQKVETEVPIKVAMGQWLANDSCPTDFTIDSDCELQAKDEKKATIKYLRHSLDIEDIRKHLVSGKEVIKLGMTWRNKISFILEDELRLKKLTPLDILSEDSEADVDLFDSDFVLMSNEVSKLLTALSGALKD